MNEREFRHYGVKGQKWGIRRALSQLGYKNLHKSKKPTSSSDAIKNGEKQKSEAKKTKVKSVAKPKPKTIRELTDEELKKEISRLQLEKQYRDLKPERVSAGKSFIDKAVKPAVNDAGKKLLTDFMIKKGKQALGLEDIKETDALEGLRKTVSELNLKKQLSDLTKDKDPIDGLKKEVQKMTLEKQYQTLMKERETNSRASDKPQSRQKRKTTLLLEDKHKRW